MGAASTTPPSYIRVRAVMWAYGRGQTDTQTRVTTIHFASSSTHAKCNDIFLICVLLFYVPPVIIDFSSLASFIRSLEATDLEALILVTSLSHFVFMFYITCKFVFFYL